MSIANKILSLFLVLLLMGCSSKETDQNRIQSGIDSTNIPDSIRNLNHLKVYDTGNKQVDTLRFEREQAYGEIYPVMMPIFPGPEVAVDSGGRVFIVDHRQNTIHAFGQDGRPLTDIGRKGRGPGEFYSLSGIEVYKDFLFAYDHVLKRISVFSLDTFKPRHTITLNSDNLHKIPALKETFLYTYFVLDDSTILAGFRPIGSKKDRPNLYYRMSWDGQIISDTVMVKPRPEGTTLTVKRGTIQLPFGRESLANVSEGGTIYTAWSDQFLIKDAIRMASTSKRYMYRFRIAG